VIDAVGVDANPAHDGPAAEASEALAPQFKEQVDEVAPKHNRSAQYKPGEAPEVVPISGGALRSRVAL